MTKTGGSSPPSTLWHRFTTATWLHLSLLLVAALLLRLWGLGGTSFWRDEIFTMGLVTYQTPFDEMLRQIISNDSHPPLYYTLAWFWTHLVGLWDTAGYVPGAEWRVRLLSVLTGVASVFFTYRLTYKLFGARAALLTGVFAALAPLWLIRDREARMYPLLALLTVASFFVLLHALERKSWRYWLGYGVTALALLYTHYLAVFVLLGQGVYALSRWRELGRAFWVALLPLLLFVPWLMQVSGGSRAPGVDISLIRWSPGELLPMLVTDVVSPPNRPDDSTLTLSIELALFWLPVVIGLVAPLLYRRARHGHARELGQGHGAWVLFTQLVVPAAAWLLVSFTVTNLLDSRYLSFVLPYLYIALAVGVLALIKLYKPVGFVWLASVLVVMLTGLPWVYQTPTAQWREAAQVLHDDIAAEDALLTNNRLILNSFRYYLSGFEAYENVIGYDMWRPSEEDLDTLLQYRRVWFVATYTPGLRGALLPGEYAQLLDAWREAHVENSTRYTIRGSNVIFEWVIRDGVPSDGVGDGATGDGATSDGADPLRAR